MLSVEGFFTMGIFGWRSKGPAPDAEAKQVASQSKPVANKRPKIDPAVAEERARKNSPWRYDDGPSRRPVGSK
ncbi:hypothetical protein [Hyphomicrobium sp.]|jgi:hypothetical protein|uniref:hypothetical protein n=1 Tax=Hyphomicrobium sp. TaxID=82 RepID=UPI000F9F7177|nr:hypothetical protein [Hyphomicrobium sp.]RUO98799.1 MAG: hypothetical protein EKK30_09650 [Hyphomicrobium sp.]